MTRSKKNCINKDCSKVHLKLEILLNAIVCCVMVVNSSQLKSTRNKSYNVESFNKRGKRRIRVVEYLSDNNDNNESLLTNNELMPKKPER
ncbi:hypothetical protein RhiirA5_427710 [Rhizophagus irregularis]|uniref:Uncharacterized protein n=1 Tax=Rhizophagus irregularis TaxID=588596 RepID=A0A2N0P1T3_9GLOM|nr:hypothetical protein RhiirA5_427710 [Rhizophagus irregularis]